MLSFDRQLDIEIEEHNRVQHCHECGLSVEDEECGTFEDRHSTTCSNCQPRR